MASSERRERPDWNDGDGDGTELVCRRWFDFNHLPILDDGASLPPSTRARCPLVDTLLHPEYVRVMLICCLLIEYDVIYSGFILLVVALCWSHVQKRL